MAYPILPVTAFIGAVLVLIPLPSHWRARNYATVSLVAWLFLLDVIYGVNSTIWNDNVRIRFLVWCDITTKLTIGASVALPAAAMCICKHLESVASGRIVRVSHADKRRRMFFELAMCYLFPVVVMALHYVVQGHRFDIVEAFGCQPATYYSIPGVFIVWFPPLLLAAVSMVYATMALYHFIHHRVTFAAVLNNASSSITPNRYLRLMALAITEIVWQIVLTAFPMYDNISFGLRPWTNWADVHSDWLRVDQYTLDEFLPSYRTQLFLFYFVLPASSLLFFLFFGFGEQAVKDYCQSADWIRCKVFRLPPRVQKSGSKGGFKLNSALSPPMSVAFSVPRFAPLSDDAHTLPAYSPPADSSRFGPTFKPEAKKVQGNFHFSTVSLDHITIPTTRSGELSPIETCYTSDSVDEFPSHYGELDHPVGIPIVTDQSAIVSPPFERPGGLPLPPRAHAHVSRFSADSDIGHAV
nr:pheromone receptor [Coriolopsis trogii]